MADPVVIVGGGIGGLSTALALLHHDIPCVVHEQAPELHELGAGIGIWPAALRVYDRLGIGDDVRALSSPWEVGGVRASDGAFLVRYSDRQFARRFGELMAGVHRGELQSVLLRALPEGVVRTGARCIGVEDDARGPVVARFEDGTSVEGRAVIAADGQRSALRAQLFTDRPMHDCRMGSWRGTLPEPPGTDWHRFMGETWGETGAFGMFPISGGRFTWFGATDEFAGGGKEEILARYGEWHHPIPEMVAATPGEAIWADHLYDRWLVRRWTAGRVALLGDAAHPMTPALGQGACQAIHDGWALAEALSRELAVPDALRAYERRRRRHAWMVTLVARAALESGRRHGPRQQALTERAVRLVPAAAMLGVLAFVSRGV